MAVAVLARALYGLGHDIFVDDGYYYSTMARNFVESGRFTYDGISETNGAHPLLFWVEVLLLRAAGTQTGPLVLYQTLVIFQAVVLALFLVLVFMRCRGSIELEERRLSCSALLPALAFLFLPGHLQLFYQGMESFLAFPLAVAFVILLLEERWAVAGLTGALLTAARLDTFVYFLLPLALFHGVLRYRRASDSALPSAERGPLAAAVERTARILAPAAAFVALYMAVNKLRFGFAMPIHGELKSSFPRLNFQLPHLLGIPQDPGAWFFHKPFQCLLLTIAATALLARRGRLPARLRHLGSALILVTMTELASLIFFQKWSKPMTAWYAWLPLWTSASALAMGFAHTLPRRANLAVSLSLGIILLALGGRGLVRERAVLRAGGNTQWWRNETIDFVRSRPPAERFAYTDCGKFSWWGERSFVNLDGLVNDFAYQERLRRGELAAYLAERGVRYLMAGIWDRPQSTGFDYEPMYRYRVAPAVFAGNYEVFEFFVYSYRYGKYSDTLRLPHEAEIWRSGEFPDGVARARYAVFDLTRLPAR